MENDVATIFKDQILEVNEFFLSIGQTKLVPLFKLRKFYALDWAKVADMKRKRTYRFPFKSLIFLVLFDFV